MSIRCHRCWNGHLHPSTERPGTLICDACKYSPEIKLEKAEEVRARTMAVLYQAQQELAAVDFSWEAWKRGDINSMPSTIGVVRSRVDRALELLHGLVP